MTPNLPIKIDKLDKRIMQLLEADSRQAYNSIGKSIGLSGESVEYRIDKLLKSGIISRLYAEPNMPKLKLKTYRLYLKVSNISIAEEKKMSAALLSIHNLQWFAACDGEWNYILRFSLSSEDEFKQQLTAILSKYGQFIRQKAISISLYQRYLPLTYLLGGERKNRTSDAESTQKTKVDTIDWKILYQLYENSRMPTTEIAAKVGLTPEAVQYRIKKLVSQRVIQHFTAWYNRELFGYDYYKVFFWFQHITPEKEKELINYCERHPNVCYITRVIGNWDLELDIDAHNVAELHNIIRDIESKFGDVIRDHSNISILDNYLPNPLKQFS